MRMRFQIKSLGSLDIVGIIFLIIGLISSYWFFQIFILSNTFMMDMQTLNAIDIFIGLGILYRKKWSRILGVIVISYNYFSMVMAFYIVFYNFLSNLQGDIVPDISILGRLKSIVPTEDFVIFSLFFLSIIQLWMLWTLVEEKAKFH